MAAESGAGACAHPQTAALTASKNTSAEAILTGKTDGAEYSDVFVMTAQRLTHSPAPCTQTGSKNHAIVAPIPKALIALVTRVTPRGESCHCSSPGLKSRLT